MARLPHVAFGLCAGAFAIGAPTLTLGQEIEGPGLDYGQAPEEPQEVSAVVAPQSARAVWLERPDGGDLQRRFPRDALRTGLPGRVVLECLIRADGSLMCIVVAEEPSEQGFGEAALRIAEKYKASALLEDGSPSPGARVRLPISFVVQQGRERN